MSVQTWEHTFEAYAQELIDELQVPGAIVAVARDGQLIYEKSFGYRDREALIPADLDTVFGIGSITKSFTCIAIMQLQEEGKLSVHDPVVKYLPEFQTPDEEHTSQVTIHHFMTHTPGLPPLSSLIPAMQRSMLDDPDAVELLQHPEFAGKEPIDTFEQLMAYIGEQPIELLGLPGTEFSYSNDAYALLGAIIERVTGQIYESFVQERILQPLGMGRSVFFIEELGDDNHSTLYAAKNKDGVKEVVRSPIWWDSPSMRAAGFLKASAQDMLRYAELFRTGGTSQGVRILSEESVKQMVTPHAKVDAVRGYGYGLGILSFMDGVRLVQHTGGLKGITAQMLILPEAGLTGIILTNVGDAPILELTLGLLNSLFSRPQGTQFASFADYDIPFAQMKQYEGMFKSGEGEEVKIQADEESEQLQLRMGDESLLLRPIGEDEFRFTRRGVDTLVRFVRNQAGEIKRFALGSRQMPKVKA